MSPQEAGTLSRFGISEGEVAMRSVGSRCAMWIMPTSISNTVKGFHVDGGGDRQARGQEYRPRVGIRAISGEKTGFAYSDELTKKALEIAADAARYIASSPSGETPVPSRIGPPRPITSIPMNGCRSR